MENNTFVYQYSAPRSREVETIRNKYLPREQSKLEQLKRLDAKVHRAGQWQSLCIGVIGVLIFGIGMCFGLDVFDGADWLSLVFGAVGVLVMIPAYPVYQHIYKKVKTALTPEILRLSDEILK